MANKEMKEMKEIQLSGGEGYGCHGWSVGEVVYVEGRYLSVLSSDSRYFREDGFCFGVGDDAGHHYRATCREATDDESEPLRAKNQAKKERKEALKVLSNLAKEICTAGTRPEKADHPDGEILADTSNGYGSGEYFVLGEDDIWHIKCHGMDGDNWDRNNVPGAIAWYIPRTDDLVVRLVAAANVLEEQNND